MSGGFESVESFFEWFPDISDIGGVNAGDLVKTSDSSFQDFSNSDSLVDGSSHGLQDNFCLLLFLEQAAGIRNIVSHFSLCGDSDFIFIDGFISSFWLFNSSVFVHFVILS